MALSTMVVATVAPLTKEETQMKQQVDSENGLEEPSVTVYREVEKYGYNTVEITTVDEGEYDYVRVMVDGDTSFAMDSGESVMATGVSEGEQIMVIGVTERGDERIVGVREV